MFDRKKVGEIVTITFMSNYKFRIDSGIIVYVKGLTGTNRKSERFKENLHNYMLLLAADSADNFISFLDDINIDKDEIARNVLTELYESHSFVSTRLNGVSVTVWSKIKELLHK